MSNKKQDLITTAFDLFSRNGFYATGIDQIIFESKTSKKTLYAHFKSKDELVEATLKHYKNQFEHDMHKELQDINEPQDKLFHLFEIAYSWYNSQKFNGCLAISAMNEYGNKNPSIKAACQAFKMAEYKLLESILKSMGVFELEKMTNNLMIVLEGITVTSHMGNISPNAKDIKKLVTTILVQS